MSPSRCRSASGGNICIYKPREKKTWIKRGMDVFLCRIGVPFELVALPEDERAGGGEGGERRSGRKEDMSLV